MPLSSEISGNTILITGGGGFIGSFLARALCKEQNKVILLDRCPRQGSSAYEMGLLGSTCVEFIQGDILDDGVVKSLPDNLDYIIHAAGILGIKTVCEKPLLTADVNVFGTRKILELATRQKNLKRFILFSTSEVYGQYAFDVDENSPSVISNVGMRWVYASSKQFSEYLLKAYIKECLLPGVIVRPFNVYGPYRQGSNAMTTLIKKAQANEEICISGNGQQKRAWCHVEDFIEGVLKCLITKNIIGESFNLGNPNECLSMYSLAEKICREINSSSVIKILESTEDDVYDRCPNINKARDILQYIPERSLSAGIQEVHKWLLHRNIP